VRDVSEAELLAAAEEMMAEVNNLQVLA